MSAQFDVTFIGGPADADSVQIVPIPLRDLSETPYVCVGDGPPYFHYTRDGSPDERRYKYVGPCADVPGPHLGH